MAKKSRVRKKITLELKQRILGELSKEECVMSSLAKAHDISVKTLYVWRRKITLTNERLKLPAKESVKLADNFIELSLEEAKDTKTIASANALGLQKAELVFNNFSFCIAGGFNSNLLIDILTIMGSHDKFRL